GDLLHVHFGDDADQRLAQLCCFAGERVAWPAGVVLGEPPLGIPAPSRLLIRAALACLSFRVGVFVCAGRTHGVSPGTECEVDPRRRLAPGGWRFCTPIIPQPCAPWSDQFAAFFGFSLMPGLRPVMQ